MCDWLEGGDGESLQSGSFMFSGFDFHVFMFSCFLEAYTHCIFFFFLGCVL